MRTARRARRAPRSARRQQILASRPGTRRAHRVPGAAATVPPAFSERVYEVIQPSLVLIQSEMVDADNNPESGLGTGVVIDDKGDILTSLHVVANAAEERPNFYRHAGGETRKEHLLLITNVKTAV